MQFIILDTQTLAQLLAPHFWVILTLLVLQAGLGVLTIGCFFMLPGGDDDDDDDEEKKKRKRQQELLEYEKKKEALAAKLCVATVVALCIDFFLIFVVQEDTWVTFWKFCWDLWYF